MTPSSPTLRIVHAADEFVVVDKPEGMLSVPGKGPDRQHCVVSVVRELFPRAEGPLVVHRLDMDTSGLLVVALTSAMQRALSMEFEQRRVHKRYIALLKGEVTHADRGTVDAALRLDPERRPYQVHDELMGRPALTHWRILAREPGRTRVELTPITGRTHQLRVHAALARPIGIGHPIIGDILYAPNDGGARLMLHAATLEFTIPGTTNRMTFNSEPGF